MNIDFSDVTEIPGQKASSDQFSIMMTRYSLIRSNAIPESVVLEMACGSGIGLGYISKGMKKVIGGDIDPNLVAIALETYQDNNIVDVINLDAHDLPFEDKTIDLVAIYEAIYYFEDLDKVLNEVYRVLSPSGKLIISTVNNLWYGFNPSPFSKQYFNAEELRSVLTANNFENKLYVGFEDQREKSIVKSFVREQAVRLGLIPKTMKGKEFLKRIFYGPLREIPKILRSGDGKIEKLINLDVDTDQKRFKQIYSISTKSEL